MSGYLHNLVLRAAAENVHSLRPRIPAIFEPHPDSLALSRSGLAADPNGQESLELNLPFESDEDHSTEPAETSDQRAASMNSRESQEARHSDALNPQRDVSNIKSQSPMQIRLDLATRPSSQPLTSIEPGPVVKPGPNLFDTSHPDDDFETPASENEKVASHHEIPRSQPKRIRQITTGQRTDTASATEPKPLSPVVGHQPARAREVHSDVAQNSDAGQVPNSPSVRPPQCPRGARPAVKVATIAEESPRIRLSTISPDLSGNDLLEEATRNAEADFHLGPESIPEHVSKPFSKPAPSLQPLTTPSLLQANVSDVPPANVVQVTIGRVEIKAVPAPRPSRPARGAAPNVMSLDEYINRQWVGSSG